MGSSSPGIVAQTVERQAALAVAADVDSQERADFCRQFGPGRMLDGDLALFGQERSGGGKERGVVAEAVRWIGEDEVERAFGRQADEAGGKGEAPDLGEALAQAGDVAGDRPDGAQVAVDADDAEGAAAGRLQAHRSAAGEEVEEAGAGHPYAPDREEGLAQAPFGGARPRRHLQGASAELPAADPDARPHGRFREVSATNSRPS